MELRTEVEIDAPPERVWAVLTDFAAYHEWNPFITQISGPLRENAQLNVHISVPEGSEFKMKPTLRRCEPNAELSWLGHLFIKGLFDGEHFFRLQPLDGGRTRFVHGENFGGILVRFFGGTLTKTARGFVYMNQALKQRVEALNSQ
jgi:hypothetical protein